MNGVSAAFTGRLGGVPDLAYTRDGKPRLSFSVAVDEHTTATEEHAAETIWVRCTVWGDLAAGLAEQLRKGSAVYCEGRVRLDKWTDKTTGEPRSGLSVSAWRCEVHGAIGRNAPNRERPAAEPEGASLPPGVSVD
jgi:single-strand DNA-binding protein